MKNKEYKPLEFVVCPYCNYNNKPENAKKYGTCTRCKQIIDAKSKFQYEMVCRLKLWKGKKWL